MRAVNLYSDAKKSPNYWDNRGLRRVRCVVWHIADGSLVGTLSWLCSPQSQASAHDVIDRAGIVHNIVAGQHAAWTNGRVCDPNLGKVLVRKQQQIGLNPNWWSYTIECVGYSARGRSGALTSLQIASLILRTAQACYVNRLSADVDHVLRHSDWDSCTRSGCPGYSPEEYSDWLTAVWEVCRSWRGW